MKWDPYSLKKPCKNCPFLKEGGIELSPGRVEGIIDDLVTGRSSSFSCHKTVHSKHGGEWAEGEDGEEVYKSSGNEKQCAGSLIMMEKMGKRTQLMQVMQRFGQYKPEALIPHHDLVIDPPQL